MISNKISGKSCAKLTISAIFIAQKQTALADSSRYVGCIDTKPGKSLINNSTLSDFLGLLLYEFSNGYGMEDINDAMGSVFFKVYKEC